VGRADDQDVAKRLAEVPLFKAVPEKIVKKIAAEGRVVQHAAGHRIVTEGDEGVAMHLILDGEADVEVHGKAHGSLGPGDHFGEIALLDGRRRSATVTSRTELRAWAITHWVFNNILDKNPELARALLVGLCARVREAEAAHERDSS
jgi:CRP-like cAMP-binding protein